MSYQAKEQDPEDWRAQIHGSRARYRKGCRCSRCTAAERRYRRAYRLGLLIVKRNARMDRMDRHLALPPKAAADATLRWGAR